MIRLALLLSSEKIVIFLSSNRRRPAVVSRAPYATHYTRMKRDNLLLLLLQLLSPSCPPLRRWRAKNEEAAVGQTGLRVPSPRRKPLSILNEPPPWSFFATCFPGNIFIMYTSRA